MRWPSPRASITADKPFRLPRVIWTLRKLSSRNATRLLLVGALVSACGSSSDGVAGRHDGGPSVDGARIGHDEASVRADGAEKCTPFGPPECGRGETCCLTGFTGSCRALDACATTTQFQCGLAKDCQSGELCCGTFMDSPNGVATATTFCKNTCTLPSHPVCITSQDCATGTTCTLLPEGSNSPVLAAAVEVYSVCRARDAGAGP